MITSNLNKNQMWILATAAIVAFAMIIYPPVSFHESFIGHHWITDLLSAEEAHIHLILMAIKLTTVAMIGGIAFFANSRLNEEFSWPGEIKESSETEQKIKGNNNRVAMKLFGYALLAFGLLLMASALSMDASILTRGGDRVYNTGLMQAQQNSLIVSVAVTLVGVALIIVGFNSINHANSIGNKHRFALALAWGIFSLMSSQFIYKLTPQFELERSNREYQDQKIQEIQELMDRINNR